MIKVLGIGSPFGDDAVGFEIVKILKQQKNLQKLAPERLSIDYYDRPGVRLIELIANAKTVILIDAVVTGNSIGSFFRLQNYEIEEAKYLLSTHEVGVGEALKLAKVLDELPEDVVFYGIEINPLNKKIATFSAKLKITAKKVAKCIDREITRFYYSSSRIV